MSYFVYSNFTKIFAFFYNKNVMENARYFTESDVLIKLVYLWYIFDKLNKFNLPLQGNNMHMLQLLVKMAAFRKKLWIKKLNDGGGEYCFPQLYKYAASNELVVINNK